MKVILNSPGYSYDVHSLVKAFFPEADVKIIENNDDNNAGENEESSPVIFITISSGDIAKEAIVSGKIMCEFCSDKVHEQEEGAYEGADRPKVKNELKLTLYRLLSKVTKMSLPWGTLTGIRPTKIPMKMIMEGSTDSEIEDYLKNSYYCSDEKIKLSTQIAHLETGILNGVDEAGFSLYVGIPFCPTTCLYCSFTSYPIAMWRNKTADYLEALYKELDATKELMGDKKPDSVYIGGGTPTTLSEVELEELIGYIRKTFDLSNIKEFTVEAGRPDSITQEKLQVLKACGITRLSINPQTMNDKTLRIIGRRHSVEDVVRAFQMARENGFDNINMDLILGLPGEDIEDVRRTFEDIKKLSPDSVTVHSMAIKRAAGMHRYLDEHTEIKSENTPEMMELAQQSMEEMGLLPYYLYRQKNMAGNFENVGYARAGKFGVYNILIMEEVQTIVACGAGTVTKRVFSDGRIERCDNVKDVNLYISKIEEMIDRKKNLFREFN